LRFVIAGEITHIPPACIPDGKDNLLIRIGNGEGITRIGVEAIDIVARARIHIGSVEALDGRNIIEQRCRRAGSAIGGMGDIARKIAH
jgi:hypothetical protein